MAASRTLGIGAAASRAAAAAEGGDAAARAGLADPDAPGGDRADAVASDCGNALPDLQRRRAGGDDLEVLVAAVVVTVMLSFSRSEPAPAPASPQSQRPTPR